MFGIPSPYLLGGAALAFLLATSGAYITGRVQGSNASDARWEAVRTTERLEAAQVKAAALERARAAENKAAETAIRIDNEHAEAVKAADATRDDFARRLRIAQTGSCRSGAVPIAPGSAGNGAPVTPRGDGGLGGASVGIRVRDAVMALQRYAVACHTFAQENGR